MLEELGKFIVGLVAGTVERATASEERRAELDAQDEANWLAYRAKMASYPARVAAINAEADAEADKKP